MKKNHGKIKDLVAGAILAGLVAYTGPLGAKVKDRKQHMSDRSNPLIHACHALPFNARDAGDDRRRIQNSALLLFKTEGTGAAAIRLHKRLLVGIIDKNVAGLLPAAPAERTHLNLTGRRITPDSDKIVANFEMSALRKAKRLDASAQKSDQKFSGYLSSLGRHKRPDAQGREVEVEVFLRIVINWNSKHRIANDMTAHQVAYLVSEIPVTAPGLPAREMFYRFRPSRHPFRMLLCLFDQGRVI